MKLPMPFAPAAPTPAAPTLMVPFTLETAGAGRPVSHTLAPHTLAGEDGPLLVPRGR